MRCSSIVRIACWLAMGAMIPGGGAVASPPQTNDSAGRASGKANTETVRVVTGDSARINTVVAGTPPSATISIVPVPAKVGSYPPGTTIVGNELRVPTGGFRAFFDVQVSNWDPNGDNIPPLGGFQATIDATGYMDSDAPGDQPDLVPPAIACANNATCVAAFGEAWARCGGTVCKAGYVHLFGTARPDSWCAPSGGDCAAGDVDTSVLSYRWFLVSNSSTGHPDQPGTCVGGTRVGQGCTTAAQCSGGGTCTGPGLSSYYGGSLILDVPVGAGGKYTVNLNTDETFMWDAASPPNDIPTLSEMGFVVNILPCTGPADCSDGLFCNGPETCNVGSGLCGAGTPPCTAPTPTCNEATDTCTGCVTTGCPDDGLFCNGTESCNLTSGLCQSTNPCLPNQVCDEATNECLNFGACCLDMGTVCFETNEPDCVDPPPDGAGGVFLGHKSTCPEQNAVVVPEGGGTVFIHVIGPPVVCPPPGPAGAVAGCPPSGPYTDPWVSDESGGLCHNFGSPDTDPIPADFFDPGSDPFTSTVCLRGVPLGVAQYGDADTLISRSADPFDRCDLPSGASSPVNIEIEALRLDSTAPITVSYTAGPDEQWDVKVDLSPGGLLPGTPPSTLTGVKTHCNGGTYTSRLYVQPRFTFTKVGDPLQVRELDTLQAGTAAVELRQDDPHPWVSDIDPFFGAMVDFCSDFHANISQNVPLLECNCNGNSRRDLCDIEDGVSPDLNGDLIPDECQAPLAAIPDSGGDKTRGLSFSAPPSATATGTPGQTAIKVTMIDLQNPNPPNLPQFPPPDFSGFEAGTCGDPGGCARWVGKPGTFLESQDTPGLGSYRAARLQCTPFYHNWGGEGLFHATGAEIVPSSIYEVRVFAAVCKGNEDICVAVSAPVTMYTRRSGDVEVPFCPPTCGAETGGQPNVTDVAQLVNKLKNLPGALVKAITQLQPNLPELNANINVLDIVAVVDAVKQRAYAFSGPCACPSVVTCGLTSCASATICVTTYGAGSTCVQTCTGPGSLAGDPCVNNTHCVGSGTCGSGFCRDRCGRCKP